jgi:predicted RND superfamily exporter protein
MGLAARRPLAVGATVALLALAGGLVALRLEPTAATGALVERGSASWRATEDLHERFGEDAVYVLVRRRVSDLVLTADLGRLLGLEGCLSGNTPAGRTPAGGRGSPCARLAASKPAQVVFGPGTFINEAAREIQEQLRARIAQREAQGRRAARAARQLALRQGRSPAEAARLAQQARRLVLARAVSEALRLGARYGLSQPPSIDDPAFVARIVFADTGPPGTPKARFAYLFPTRDSALVQVRLRPDLSEAERRRAIADVRAATQMPRFRLSGGGSYTVTGAPVVLQDLTESVSRSLVVLLVAALAVMAAVLAVAFRARRRLLPLAVALAASGLTFGAFALAGASLTMASVAVLPVLIGLSVDYAVQLQARVQEEAGAGAAARGEPHAGVSPGPEPHAGVSPGPEPLVPGGGPYRAAVDRAARRGAPTVAVAATATAAGFLVLALSPLPMVRGFGVLLVAGIALALGCALTLGVAGLAPRSGRWAGRRGRGAAAVVALAAAWRGAGEIVADNGPARAARRAAVGGVRRGLRGVAARPGRVLAVAAALAVAGWAVDPLTEVESDVTRLVPQDLPALQDLEALQRSTGVGGQLDVLVEGDDLTDPAVVRWMTRYQRGVLTRYGYRRGRGCGRADVCPAFSLPDLFSGGPSSRSRIEALLDAVPTYFSQGVITDDRRAATLSFGIRLMPLAEQQEIISELRRRLDPPGDVSARLAGLPVLAAEANAAISSPLRRLAMVVAGLAAVGLVLLLAFRRWQRAAVPLVPIVLATGWSALVLFALRIPLNPMSVTLAALVIAISTEFSVLLSERYGAERRAGRDPRAALDATYRSTGAAVLASGATAIAGFAVLVVSDIAMLRDFGFVTVVDLLVSLAGVLVVLPAVLLLAERRNLLAHRPGPSPPGPAARPPDERPPAMAGAGGRRA